ncbi:tetratricopeptide repeat protein [Fulvivirga sp. M361]|uniref:tetratricopeptide repeat protein n=1 Tax=Fulvivirga sp. M361 TaxID=2594266 RepID=UPI001624FD4D|nr:tetratricopeptide repeat protein [Fulvivirga sp. M361]
MISSMLFFQDVKTTDSLIKQLDEKDLTTIEIAQLKRRIAFYHTDYVTGLNYATQSLDLSETIGNKVLQAEAWEEIGHIQRRLGNTTASFEAALKALEIFESLNLKEKQVAVYNQIIQNYVVDQNFEEAIKYLKTAIDIYRNIPDSLRFALTMINLGEVYRMGGQPDSALSSFEMALSMNHSLKSEVVRGYSIGNMGMVYSSKGQMVLAKKNLTSQLISLHRFRTLILYPYILPNWVTFIK